MICDPWIDRDYRRPRAPDKRHRMRKPSTRVTTSPAEQRELVNEWRAALARAGQCIDGPKDGFVGTGGVVHGPVYKGRRCLRCYVLRNGGDMISEQIAPTARTRVVELVDALKRRGALRVSLFARRGRWRAFAWTEGGRLVAGGGSPSAALEALLDEIGGGS
jgi:hypothetical protein